MSVTPPPSRQPYRVPRPPIEWRRAIAWIVCLVGAVLFVVSFVASSAGVVVLPFDRHHIFGQAGGLLLAISGVSVANRRPRTRQ
jgi:hypothetical protein